MAGHNKWTQIKRKKGITDAEKSKLYSKLARLISLESRRSGGNISSPSLRAVIDQAKSQNIPKDIIERAVKKGVGGESGALMPVTYEAYGPGGVALIIEGLTDNRNKAASEIKHILSKHGATLGAIGSAAWAFKKTAGSLLPQVPVEVDEATANLINNLTDELKNNDEVQNVFTNASIKT